MNKNVVIIKQYPARRSALDVVNLNAELFHLVVNLIGKRTNMSV